MKKIFYTFLLISPLLFVSSCGEDAVHGCLDSQACNYNPEASLDNNSCEYAIEGFDCDGNELLQIGDLHSGGIVFYVDETGEHGLVAALEDIGQFEWGCNGEDVNGAEGEGIGTGYQNTMDIINFGCVTESGGITAAQAALDAEINGYNDWYLPSIDELKEMYNTIGNVGTEGNVGGLEYYWYWSSSEFDNYNAWFGSNDIVVLQSFGYKGASDGRVRVIRSF